MITQSEEALTYARVNQKVEKGGRSGPVFSCDRSDKQIELVSRELYKIQTAICPAN